MMKYLIGMIMVLLILSVQVDACILQGSVITNPAQCPFILGAKIQVTAAASRIATFNLDVVGNFSNVAPSALLKFFPFTFGDTFSVQPTSWSCQTVSLYSHCTLTMNHQYPTNVSSAYYTYEWHILSLRQSSSITFGNINSTAFDYNLNGNVLIDGSFISSPSVPNSYYVSTTETPLQIGNGSYCNLDPVANSDISTSVDTTGNPFTCVFTSTLTRFSPSFVKVNIGYFGSERNSDTTLGFGFIPTCCRDVNTILLFNNLFLDTSLSCLPEGVDPYPQSNTFKGGCGTVTLSATNATIPAYTCGTLQRQINISDSCPNNIKQQTQTVVIADTVFPVIHKQDGSELFGSVPSLLKNLECRENITGPIQNLYSTDTCTPGSLPIIETTTNTSTNLNDTCKNNFIFIRTYSSIDNCGNNQKKNEVFQVYDNIPPTFDFVPPAYQTAICSFNITKYVLSGKDNCVDPVRLITSESKVSGFQGFCQDFGVYNISWRLTDNCDNNYEIFQVVNITDTVPPSVIGLPSSMNDERLSCLNQIPTNDLIAKDNCKLTSDVISPITTYEGQGCNINATQTWTVADACGNSAGIFKKRYIINDSEPPTYENVIPGGSVPKTQTFHYQCLTDFQPYNPPTLIAYDACTSFQVNVDYVSTTEPFNPNITNPLCLSNTIQTFFWTTNDGCPNYNNITVQNIVADTIPPSFYNLPDNNTYYQCVSEVPSPALTYARDNCDETVQTNYLGETQESCSANQCSNRVFYYRSWDSTDNCGNTGTITQRLVVYDNTAPVWNEPWDTVSPGIIPCDQVPFFRIPCRTASDNCGQSVTVETNFYGSLSSASGLIVDYVATDSCGNVNLDRRTILSDCPLIPSEPILANYEPNPPMCRPLLAIPDTNLPTPNITLLNDPAKYTNCTIVNGTYNCDNRTSFTIVNGTIVTLPYPLDNSPAPPSPICTQKRRRDVEYEELYHRLRSEAPRDCTPIINADYSFFYCPKELVECYRPTVAGSETLDPFRLCPSYLYTTLESNKRDFTTNITISPECLAYLQIPVCPPDERTYAGQFFYKLLFQSGMPVSSVANREFWSRSFTTFSCEAYNVFNGSGSIEIIDQDGFCQGPLCQRLYFNNFANNENPLLLDSPCDKNCVSTSNDVLPDSQDCITIQKPTTGDCSPYTIQSIDGFGNVICGQFCLREDQITDCNYGLKSVSFGSNTCATVQDINTCDIDNADQVRIKITADNSDGISSNTATFAPGTPVYCNCDATGQCSWISFI